MAEKNFKITGGLALGDYALTANGLSLLWDSNALATQAYVATQLSGATVNTNAIAGSLASTTLYVSDGDNLNVNVNAFVNDIDGSGLYVDGVTLAVNTNAIATKAYVDGVAQGLDVKQSVRVAKTTQQNSGPTLVSIDGITLNEGDRFLLTGQTDATENGIYVKDGFSLTRAADANTTEELNKGAFTFVEEGTVNAGKGFVVTAAGTLGTDAITWSQFSEAGSLTAGSNIYLSSGSINVNVNSLVGNLDGFALYVDGNNALAVNTVVLASDMDGGPGIYFDYGTEKLGVNTNALVGNLDGFALYVDGNNALAVNTVVLASDMDGGPGIYFDYGTDKLGVNTNALVGNLDGLGLYIDANYALAINTNALAGTGLVSTYANGTISLDQYAAGVRYDGTSGSGGNANVTTDTFYATTETSDTYVLVGTIAGPRAFTLDVYMKNSAGYFRKSTISGITDSGGNVEYTEYAIVDSATAITAPDVLVDWNSGEGRYDIKAKATLSASRNLKVVINASIMDSI